MEKDDRGGALPVPPKRWRFDAFADVRMGKSLFELRPEDWLVPDTPNSGDTHD